jgi:hypothetical protein
LCPFDRAVAGAFLRLILLDVKGDQIKSSASLHFLCFLRADDDLASAVADTHAGLSENPVSEVRVIGCASLLLGADQSENLD